MKKLVLALTVILIIGFNSCNNKDGDVIKIAAILPMTGSTSYIGNSIMNGLELGKSLYGDKLPIEIKYQDSQGNPANAVSAYHHIKQTEKANIVISGGSAVANALLPLTENDKALHIATAVAAAKFPEKGQHCFRLFLSADTEAKLTALFCLNKLNAKKATVLYVNDDFGLSYLQYFSSEFKKGGGEIVFSGGFARNQHDLKDIITKTKPIKSDVIYLVSNNDYQGNVIRQIREQGINTPVITLLTILKEENIKGAGNAIEGVYYAATDFDPKYPLKNQEVFSTEYQKKYNQSPDAYAAFAADIMHFLCDAVKNGNKDAESIESYLRTMSIGGIMGNVKFHDSGDCEFGIQVKQIVAGESVNIP